MIPLLKRASCRITLRMKLKTTKVIQIQRSLLLTTRIPNPRFKQMTLEPPGCTSLSYLSHRGPLHISHALSPLLLSTGFPPPRDIVCFTYGSIFEPEFVVLCLHVVLSQQNCRVRCPMDHLYCTIASGSLIPFLRIPASTASRIVRVSLVHLRLNLPVDLDHHLDWRRIPTMVLGI